MKPIHRFTAPAISGAGSGYAPGHNGFEGFQDAENGENVVGGGKVAGVDGKLSAFEGDKLPAVADDEAAVNRQSIVVQGLPGEHSPQALPQRVAVWVSHSLVFLKREVGCFRMPATSGYHPVGVAAKLNRIDDCRKFALFKVVRVAGRKVDQCKDWPDKVRMEFGFVPGLDVEGQRLLIIQQRLPFKVGDVGSGAAFRHRKPDIQRRQVVGLPEVEVLFKHVGSTGGESNFSGYHDFDRLILPQRYNPQTEG
jgi:hypothetical protein